MKSGTVALLTDFGWGDWYVGAMKGVLLSVNPQARIVDVTHAVPPEDILAASFALVASRNAFPAGTVFAVVVDPGVGGPRGVLCAESRGRFYLAPDNGVLTEVLDKDGVERLVSVENKAFFLEKVSSTFHGRDIFAPVAGHLSLGVEMDTLGPKADRYSRCEVPRPRVEAASARAAVRWIDSFGNLITDCSEDLLSGLLSAWKRLAIDVGSGTGINLGLTYQSAKPGEPLGLVGSSGYLEISVRGGSAARAFAVNVGDPVTLRRV